MQPNDLFSNFFPEENPSHITSELSEEIKSVIIKRLVQMNHNDAAHRIKENDFSELVLFVDSDVYYAYLQTGYKKLAFVVCWKAVLETDLQKLQAWSRNDYYFDESIVPVEETEYAYEILNVIYGLVAAEKLIMNGGKLLYGADHSKPIAIEGHYCLTQVEKDDVMLISHSTYDSIVDKIRWESAQMSINGRPIETKPMKYDDNK